MPHEACAVNCWGDTMKLGFRDSHGSAAKELYSEHGDREQYIHCQKKSLIESYTADVRLDEASVALLQFLE